MKQEDFSTNYNLGDKVLIRFYTAKGQEDIVAAIVDSTYYDTEYDIIDINVSKYDLICPLNCKNIIRKLSEEEFESLRILEGL